MKSPEEMSCERVRRYLSPYMDSELDAAMTCEVSRHLEICRNCARLFHAEQELEKAIADELRKSRGDEDAVFGRALRRAVRPRRWLAAAGLLAVAVMAGVTFHSFLKTDQQDVPELLQMVAKDHQQYLRGNVTPEFRPGGPHELADFLGRHLEGTPSALPPGEGWALEGARICRFKGTAIGFLTLRYHGIPVSVADLSGDMSSLPAKAVKAARHGRCFELAEGRGLLGVTRSGIRAAFGNVEMARLEEVIDAAR